MKKINSKYQQRWSQSHFYLILFFLDSCFFFFFNKSYYHCLDYSLPPLNFQQIQSESRRMVDSFDAVCKESLIPPGCPNESLNKRWYEYRQKGWGGLQRAASPEVISGFLSPILLQRTLWAVSVLQGSPSHLCFQKTKWSPWPCMGGDLCQLLINGLLEYSPKSFSIPQMVFSVVGLGPAIWKCCFVT